MQTEFKTPVFALTSRPTGDIDVELLVVPIFEDDDLADQPDLRQATGGEFARAQERGQFHGKLYEVLISPAAASGWKAATAVLVGAGTRADLTADRLRRIAIVGGLAARQRRATRMAILHRPGNGVAADHAVQAIAEGACFANFDGGSFKTDTDNRSWLAAVVLRVDESTPELEQAMVRGSLSGEYTNQARSMANAPGNQLSPRVFAERARVLAESAGLAVEILDEARIGALNMGLLLGVARGSHEPPRMVVLKYEPADAMPGMVLGLVGKGITFDTGGISIKPADSMEKMKDDMAGGAAVVCAMAALARLRAPIRCVGVIPMTENMPGGNALKPGDVLTSAEGKTVEVINTDAEGRLVLGDGLWYARQLGATHLVDLATLTGACVVALGRTTSGLFGTPTAWVERVRLATDRAGDRAWPMPVFDDYREQLKSDIADFTNTGGRAGGAITAALFVKEFTGGLPWVHMDIAGTAWADDPKPYQPKGATGVGVRTLIELGLDAVAWSKLTLQA
jgi:leucyl aminopeptidase